MPFNLGFGELLVVMVVALLVFGGRLPQMGKSLGQGIKQFKRGLSDNDEDSDVSETEASPDEDAGDSCPGLLEAPEEEEIATEVDPDSTPRTPAP